MFIYLFSEGENMSILLKHSEDKKYHIYKRRESVFNAYLLLSVILFVSSFLALKLIMNWKLALVLMLLFIGTQVLAAIDRWSFAHNHWKARSKGKEIIQKGGGILFGPTEIKIEK